MERGVLGRTAALRWDAGRDDAGRDEAERDEAERDEAERREAIGASEGADQLRALDEELAGMARREAALRLRLGQVLEVLGRGGHAELGFSSLGAYALERCERSVRWTEAARCLARRAEVLVELRQELASGRISWSMAELVARVATPHTVKSWLGAAKRHTVRQMRAVVRSALAARCAPECELDRNELPDGGVAETVAGEEGAALGSTVEGAETCTLTCTVDQEDAWLFEATRTLLDHLGERTADEQVEALFAEAQSTLIAALPRGALDGLEAGGIARRRWREELARRREAAEASCEGRVAQACGRTDVTTREYADVAAQAEAGCSSVGGASPRELDGIVRRLCSALARYELDLSRCLLELHRAGGFAGLGYATERQYAQERLGMSLSALLSRRALAGRLENLPGVAEALGAGELGVEAALQITRVATRATERAWLERARRRTIKHLREEVAAALVALRLSGQAECPPPDDAELAGFQELERAVVSGEICSTKPAGGAPEVEGGRSDERRDASPWHAALGSLGRWLECGLQTSAGFPKPNPSAGAGRVTIRLRVSTEIYEAWRGLEAWAQRWLPKGMTWLRFACLAVWRAWEHVLDRDEAYHSVYVRDRFRCTSPVCLRRDITPHHIVFRSAGGSDEDENVTSLCVGCHLFGVHAGHMHVAGKAPNLEWELGSRAQPCVVVKGRERVAA